METARLFKLVCVICIASLIPTLRANVAETDEYWVKKANEARKHTLLAYHPDPYAIVDHFHERHYDNSTDVEEAEEHEAAASAEEDDIEIISSPTNSTRRSLTGRAKKGKWSKLKGPCTASNPIDKCWRCQADWAKRRKKLVHCVRGFGYRTTGGKRGRIYVVTSPRDDDVVNPKPGTLRHAVIQKEPLWIIFKHDMSIRLSQELMINSHKTIDARGANVHIAYGAGITMQYVRNIIIHGLHVHHIVEGSGGLIRNSVDHFGQRGRADGDGISIFGATNIWLDHISMSKCQDGLIDAIMGSTGITISNSHFTHHNDVSIQIHIHAY
ncbi:unnamed protein product [Arabis nemorensis]|uniref:Pectate lyase n=1 Tax=Arabis nemorensis TaxID=586526 RepID=A0A565B430_9BRAS|nr:unnamed protein product [Arabis nemorensis]